MEHQDHHASVVLPLRLAAEPYAKKAISPSCVSLGIIATASSDAVELAFLCDDDGIHAFCTSRLVTRQELLVLLEAALSIDDWTKVPEWNEEPLLLLVRDSGSHQHNKMQWHHYAHMSQHAQLISGSDLSKHIRPVHNEICAQLVTTSIRHYYSQQILEPSVRGFLSVLEKQFGRSDLYLFELLQNAVDDGATVVEFALGDSSLQLQHNGRSFTPLDVLGLSSVGLSTKSRQGKRTIGFMGVGFKAVYKRYARVIIDDGNYRFVYQEPPNNQMGYGWVMLPMWQKPQHSRTNPDRKGWCHFALEQPRGGVTSIRRDLLVLPRTAPPLLGRAALVKMESQSCHSQWVLDWNGKHHTIQRSQMESYNNNNMDGSELISVNIHNRKTNTTKLQPWLFVTHRYKPSPKALATYSQHTKRSYEGFEEVCGFVQLSPSSSDCNDAVPQTIGSSGWIHSVLPTKIRMPIPMHFQGSWLLSVDRQQVQDLTDNAWNSEILQQFPHLLASLFRWAAKHNLEATKTKYEAISELLPMPPSVSRTATGSLSVDLLGQTVSLQSLERAFALEPILPVGKSLNNKASVSTNIDSMEIDNEATIYPEVTTTHYEGKNAIWVPPSWFNFLDADFMRGWLGKRPLRTDFLSPVAAYHPLFASAHVICQLNPLPSRTRQLAAELELHKHIQAETVWKAIRIMAAIGSAYDLYPGDKSNVSNTNTGGPFNNLKKKPGNKVDELAATNKSGSVGIADVNQTQPSLPGAMADWPIFITEYGGMAKLNEIVLPGEDFSKLPPELLPLLHPYLLKANRKNLPGHQLSRSGSGKRDNNNKRQMPTIKRLHSVMESAIYAIDRSTSEPRDVPNNFKGNEEMWNQISSSAASFLYRAREELPGQVVDVSTAASNLLESYSFRQELPEEDILAVLQLTTYAFETSNHLLLKYVLVDDKANENSLKTKLVPATAAYIGKDLDDAGTGADLESFAGAKLRYLSSRYNSILSDSELISRKKALQMFASAGTQTGIAIEISFTSNSRVLERIEAKLPERKLPQLRKNATKNNIFLPYGLDQAMVRRKHYLLDSSLPAEWEQLATLMSPTSSIGFISLLLSIPVEAALNVTPKTVPAASYCLSGKTEVNDKKAAPTDTVKLSRDAAAPLHQRLYFLPPGQPGAKAINVSTSRFLQQLEAIKWLPCSVASSGQSSLALFRPREALLEADPSRPEMPVVAIPPPLLKRLKSSQIATQLTWGTEAPPPPVNELTELAREAERCLSVEETSVDKEFAAIIASRMFDTWIAICRSHKQKGLSPLDRKTLRTLSSSKLPCIPVRRVLDGCGSSMWMVPAWRCLLLPDTMPDAIAETENVKHLTIVSMVASDFLCDFSHSSHNPFFQQPEVSLAVIELAGIQTLATVQTPALIKASGSLIRYCCKAEPSMHLRGSTLRESFSFCLHWCLKNPAELPSNGNGLKLYVRHGPGIGTKALPARWVAIKGGPVQAVLGDSKTRSALLSPEMKIQLLGVLDHSVNDKGEHAQLLASIDAKTIKALGISRLSDKGFVVKTRARGSPTVVEKASSKIQLVCALLKAMELDRLTHTTSMSNENIYLDPSYEPPLMIRHDSLTREFQAPGMDAPTSIPLYAMFGKAPKLSKKKCILVSGDHDDYAMELEELIFDHVDVRTTLSMSQTKPYRAAARLLSHLENDSSFDKFIVRDFADFEATAVWRKLMDKKRILEELNQAQLDRDSKQLRKLLVEGEEVFEDDEDGGDSKLHKSRALLKELEEIARLEKERQAKEDTSTPDVAVSGELGVGAGKGIGRGIDNRPAWMTIGNDDALLKGTENAEESIEEMHATEANLGQTGNGTGQGRGRGIDNRPAWMSTGGEDALPTEAERSADDQKTTALGRGRGVINLPAWMTSGEGPVGKTAEENNDASSTKPTLTEDVDAGHLQVREAAKSILSSILNQNDTSEPSKDESSQTMLHDPTSLGKGRGRGVSNLPAWMTNTSQATSDGPVKNSDDLHGESEHSNAKRNYPSSTIDDDEVVTSKSKKARLNLKSLKVSLEVELPPSQEADFLSWLEPNVKEGAEKYLGTINVFTSERKSSTER